MTRPTGTPATAETTRAPENAAFTPTDDQPVSALMIGAKTGNA